MSDGSTPLAGPTSAPKAAFGGNIHIKVELRHYIDPYLLLLSD
jgi:hypothetical protein